eukprot:4091090-Prymnesium_polylepis.1
MHSSLCQSYKAWRVCVRIGQRMLTGDRASAFPREHGCHRCLRLGDCMTAVPCVANARLNSPILWTRRPPSHDSRCRLGLPSSDDTALAGGETLRQRRVSFD